MGHHLLPSSPHQRALWPFPMLVWVTAFSAFGSYQSPSLIEQPHLGCDNTFNLVTVHVLWALELNCPEVTAQLHLLWISVNNLSFYFYLLSNSLCSLSLTATVKTLGQVTIISLTVLSPGTQTCTLLSRVLHTEREVLAVEHPLLTNDSTPLCGELGWPSLAQRTRTTLLRSLRRPCMIWSELTLLISLSYFPLFPPLASWNCLTSFSHQWLLYFWSFSSEPLHWFLDLSAT